MKLEKFCCCRLFFCFLATVCVAGCKTQYGYEFIEESSVQAAAPQLHKLGMECNLTVTHLQLKEVQKRILRDYCHTTRLGERDYFKEYCGYSDKEKAILLPMAEAFPCIAWGMTMITGKFPMSQQSNWDYMNDYFGYSVKSWGVMIGFGVIANIFLGAGDLVYYVGGSVWSLLAIPSYYIWNRTVGVSGNYEYQSNHPGAFYSVITAPFISLFAPGYIPPSLNHGTMLTKDRLYPTPVKLKAELVKEIPQVLKKEIAVNTPVKIIYGGKTYNSKVARSGCVKLPFKLYPLPARRETMTIEIQKYKSQLQTKPADIKKVISFNTADYLSVDQAKLYKTARNTSLDFMKRFRAMYKLKNAIRPQDFKAFETDPEKFLTR